MLSVLSSFNSVFAWGCLTYLDFWNTSVLTGSIKIVGWQAIQQLNFTKGYHTSLCNMLTTKCCDFGAPCNRPATVSYTTIPSQALHNMLKLLWCIPSLITSRTPYKRTQPIRGRDTSWPETDEKHQQTPSVFRFLNIYKMADSVVHPLEFGSFCRASWLVVASGVWCPNPRKGSPITSQFLNCLESLRKRLGTRGSATRVLQQGVCCKEMQWESLITGWDVAGGCCKHVAGWVYDSLNSIR